MQAYRLLLIATLAGAVGAPAWAADIEGSADHPLVGRFEGSEIIKYGRDDFDEYPLIIQKVGQYGGLDKNLNAARMVEGRVIRITYQAPAERSTLEVFRAYQDALSEHGFQFLFECSDAACGGRNFNHASPGYRAYHRVFGENYREQRYLAAHLPRDEGDDVYVAVHTARNTAGGGSSRDMIFAQVDVVEVKAREGKVVVVKADEMAERIAQTGKVALYGLYFDTDKAAIKPDSEPALDEIGKLLKNNPALKALVVGHTDNQGGFDYNIDLSQRRAAAVAEALVTDYGIDRDRLKSWGVGYTAPVASNKSEEGRARNRRVELVEQ